MRRMAPVTLTAFALTAVAAATDPNHEDLGWDNGLSFRNGISNIGGRDLPRRSILDDFYVGSVWAVLGVNLKYAWVEPQFHPRTHLLERGLEITLYGDAGGRPDFDNLVEVARNVRYHDAPDPKNPDFFGLRVFDISVRFDKFLLDEGTYWLDMNMFGPVHGFQVIGEYPQARGAPIWIDYEDLGGRQPGKNLFGDDYDVNFQIIIKELPGSIPAPATIALLAIAGIAGPRRRRP